MTFYYNFRPVFIRDFGAWVERSSSDSDFRFAEEFEVWYFLLFIFDNEMNIRLTI